MALELLSVLSPFENPINCGKISLDSRSFAEKLKGLLGLMLAHVARQ